MFQQHVSMNGTVMGVNQYEDDTSPSQPPSGLVPHCSLSKDIQWLGISASKQIKLSCEKTLYI